MALTGSFGIRIHFRPFAIEPWAERAPEPGSTRRYFPATADRKTAPAARSGASAAGASVYATQLEHAEGR